jgi:putative membrane protein
MLYKSAKLMHLVGLVLWLGPSTGAYLLIILARYEQQGIVELWLLREYLNLIHLEVLGIAVLIASGTLMRVSNPALAEARWLKLKLLIVFLFFVPIEAAQLLIYHLVVKKALLTGESVEEAVGLFDTFSFAVIAPLALAIFAVFLLAIFRPNTGLFARREQRTRTPAP